MIGPRANDESEIVLLKRIADKDRDAFKELYALYHKRLFVYLSKIISERETVEEVFNDAMFDIWRYAEKFRGDSKPSTWIFGIARNKALNALRQQKGKDKVEIETVELESDAQDNPQASTEQSELNEKIKDALQHLSSEHREVIELTFYQGFSYSEIANIVKCPVNTVKTRMFHARRILRGLLEEKGLR